TITIPALMISQADGARLRAQLNNGLTLTLNRSGLQRDGSLDNAVIAHEYGHGLSNRLTGGPSNVSCLTAEEQAGEGWSDALALMLTAKATDTATTKQTIGTWLTGQPANGGGFRQFPYTTDMAENPHTYDALKQTTLAVPHGVGSVWTAMVWEMYWNLVAEYGFDPDLYAGDGGNNLALRLMIDGMKLQPCNPTFVEARDAILAADLAANDGVNRCAIWRGFAKRGLGFSATAGLATSRFDGAEAFDLPPLCVPDLGISLTRAPAGVLRPGQLVTYTLAFSNAGQLVAQSGIISAAISPLLTNIAITATGAPVTPRVGILYGWDVSDLAYLEGGAIQISGRINPDLTADAALNSSVAIGDPADTNPFNNGALSNATVTVPQASLAPATLTVSESGGTAALTVTLSAAPLAPVRIRVATADGTAAAGSDYQAVDTIITIPAGATQAAVTITLIDDSQAEPSESFTVALSPVAGAGAASSATVTISDGDRVYRYLPLLAKP
ncbi:MAG TPA: M36 family metallopeptidase, partial [Herpetosiphonaceae bacterium]